MATIKQVGNSIVFHFGNSHHTAQDIQRILATQSLIILDQVHGNKGLRITKENSHMPFKSAHGDFLVTNEKNIGLGVLTADCLPIVFVDTVANAVGIAHAGWRGSVQNVAIDTLECMQKNYGTSVKDVSVFFGPCARICCYEVQKDFIEHILPFPFAAQTMVQRGNNLFFDLPAFNRYQLLSFGLPQTAFNDQYNYCTICNEDYFSSRRQGNATGRQVSVVLIK